MLVARCLAGLCLITLGLFACGEDAASADDDDGSSSSSSSSSSGDVSSTSSSSSSGSSSGGSSSGGGGECTASFVWLQKDAYKETGGRSVEVWPPHTTTQLIVECPSGTRTPFQGNHGSEPGQLDPNGQPLLEEVHRESTSLTSAEADQLIAQYTDCVCEPGTTFLSMDSVDQALVPQLLEQFIEFVEDSGLRCGTDGVDTGSFVLALQEQRFESALLLAPTCNWAGGNAESGLDEALQNVLASTTKTLADYHVCNNDAKLQAGLFRAFASARTLTACDRSDVVCKGPAWFYDPTAP